MLNKIFGEKLLLRLTACLRPFAKSLRDFANTQDVVRNQGRRDKLMNYVQSHRKNKVVKMFIEGLEHYD